MKKNGKKAFTLIELLVVIFLIIIATIGGTQLSFNTLNDRQKLDSFINKVMNHSEEVRNNALLGKGIGNDLHVPKQWRIEFLPSSSGSVTSKYLSGSWREYEKINFEKDLTLKNIKCLSIDETFSENISSTGTIEISGTSMDIKDECDDVRYKKLQMTFSFKNNLEKVLEINTVNGIISIKE